MANLAYKTRGNSSPQGKERVYFACNPADFSLYFETVCEDIFATQNCVIWYDAELEDADAAAGEEAGDSARADAEEEKKAGRRKYLFHLQQKLFSLFRKLFGRKSKRTDTSYDASENTLNTSPESPEASQPPEKPEELLRMRLFVIPVTLRFLREPSRARDEEFCFALAHHIPILPLLQEEGLAEEFNRVCGNFQCLDRHMGEYDPTELPYEKKLEAFLGKTLLGDELAARVRGAFSAYIFLSYRKKDRKHAQELMHLIHRNEFCRDIAIWYDEFLVPGEDFNDAILDAMGRSSAFVMVVTPNLVNEKNYVMTTEYPKAVEAGMPILAAEMLPTERDALLRSFPGIRDFGVTDARNSRALEESLAVNLLREKKRKTAGETSDSQEHETAGETSDSLKHENVTEPLNGLKQESLAAAEHDYLIGLAYLGGIDVEENKSLAAELIARAAEQGLGDAYVKIANMYADGDGVPRDLEQAAQWMDRLILLRRTQYETGQTEEEGYAFFTALDGLGEWLRRIGKGRRAEKTVTEMITLAQELAVRFPSLRSHIALALAFREKGNLLSMAGRYAEAGDYYEKALEQRIMIAENTDDDKSIRDLGLAYADLGNVRKKEGRFQDAEELLCRGMAYFRQRMEEAPSAHTRRDYAISCVHIGDLLVGEKEYQKAEQYYETGLPIFEALLEEFRTAQRRKDVVTVCHRLGDAHMEAFHIDQAGEVYKKAAQHAVILTRVNGTVEAHRLLVVSCNKLGVFYTEKDDCAEAKIWFEKALKLCLEMNQTAETTAGIWYLSVLYGKLGENYYAENDIPHAEECFEKSLSQEERLVKEAGGNSWRMAVTLCRLGNCYQMRGKTDDAAKQYRRAREKAEALVRKDANFENLLLLSHICGAQGDIFRSAGEMRDAEQLYRESLSIIEKIVQETDETRYRKEYSSACTNMGDLQKEKGDLKGAEEFYAKMLEVNRKLVEEMGTSESRAVLCRSLLVMVILYQQLETPEKAEAACLEAVNIAESLAAESKTQQNRRTLSMAYSTLADIYKKEGILGNAMKLYQKTLSLNEELAGEQNTVDNRQYLGISWLKTGGCYQAEGNLWGGRDAMKKGLRILEELAQETGRLEDWRYAGGALTDVGMAYYMQNEMEKAMEYFEQGLRLREKLAGQTGLAVDYDDLACACYYCGIAEEGEKGRQILQKAIAIWQRLAAECPTGPRYAQKAETAAGYLREGQTHRVMLAGVWHSS